MFIIYIHILSDCMLTFDNTTDHKNIKSNEYHC